MGKRVRYWFRTEYQRAAAMLPLLLLRSAVIVCCMGMAFSGLSVLYERYQEKKQPVIQIGYVAKEDVLTDLLVSYVEDMKAFEGWCELVSVTKEQGWELLQNQELEALLVLPENVVEEIISGSNAPAKLYLPKQSSAMGIVFEELADAGIQMLTVAQGEIYAIYELAGDLSLTKEQLFALSEDINRYNLGLVMGREDLFKERRLSLTGSEGMAVYYVSAVLTMYLLLCGCFFGRYIKHSEQEQLLMWKRLGISLEVQLLGRILITALLLLVALIPMAGLWLLPRIQDIAMPFFSWQGILLVLLAVICVAAYIQLLYQLSEQHRVAIVMVVLFAVVQGYIAGCLIPTVLLPQVIGKIAVFLPATYIRQAFSMLFTGGLQNVGSVCVGLMLTLLVFVALNLLVMHRSTRSYALGGSSKKVWKQGKSGTISGTIFGIYAKRLLYRKSFWCSLCVVMLVSVVLVRLERQSETTIYAAFYDESGEWEETLSSYKGYIQFIPCDSQEAVKQQVLRNEAECGYIIPKDFKERIQEERANRCIEVYKDADAIMTDTMNEILFEKLFEVLSKEWFLEYMKGTEKLLPVLEQKMTDGSTFYIEKEYWQTNQDIADSPEKGRTTYPAFGVMITAVLLCGLTGVLEAVEDYRKYRFFHRKKAQVIMISIIQPVICGVLTGLLFLVFQGYFY